MNLKHVFALNKSLGKKNLKNKKAQFEKKKL